MYAAEEGCCYDRARTSRSTVVYSSYLFRLRKSCKSQPRNGVPKEFSALVSVLAAYSLFGLFEKAVLFDITFMVVIFWAILGYAMSFLPAGQEQGAASISRPVFRLSSPYQSRYLCAVPVPTRMERVLIDIQEAERPAVLHPKMIQYQQRHPSPQYRGTEQKACSLRAASSSFPN